WRVEHRRSGGHQAEHPRTDELPGYRDAEQEEGNGEHTLVADPADVVRRRLQLDRVGQLQAVQDGHDEFGVWWLDAGLAREPALGLLLPRRRLAGHGGPLARGRTPGGAQPVDVTLPVPLARLSRRPPLPTLIP